MPKKKKVEHEQAQWRKATIQLHYLNPNDCIEIMMAHDYSHSNCSFLWRQEATHPLLHGNVALFHQAKSSRLINSIQTTNYWALSALTPPPWFYTGWTESVYSLCLWYRRKTGIAWLGRVENCALSRVLCCSNTVLTMAAKQQHKGGRAGSLITCNPNSGRNVKGETKYWRKIGYDIYIYIKKPKQAHCIDLF